MSDSAQERIPGVELTDEGTAFELEGDADSLRALATALETPHVIEISAGTQRSSSVLINRTAGAVVMRRESSGASIQGGQEELHALATTIRFVADGPEIPSSVPYHSHVEHWPGHPWLDPASEPVIVSLRD